MPPCFLCIRNLSTSFFGCNTPYIIIAFLDFLSTSFSSLSFHCSIPTPYLNTVLAYEFIAVDLFSSFSFDFRTNRILGFYSFIIFVFHFILFDLIQFNYAQICVSFVSTSFISSQFRSFIPSHLTTFPLFMVRVPHFFIPFSIPKNH